MKRRSGQTAVMMALSLTTLFGLVGFSVDLGTSYYTKQKAQGAAESAALAAATYAKSNFSACGSNGITCNSTLTSCSSITSGVLYVGCEYAHQNGFPMSAISMAANTTANASAPCSPCTSPTYWIQAQVSTTNDNLFLGVAKIPTAAVNAQAISGLISSGSSGGSGTVAADCMWALDPADKQTFFVSGASVSLASCGAQVNSTATDPVNKQPSNSAANANGSSTLTPNGVYNVVGAGDYNQNYCQTGGPFVCGAPSVANPLAGLRRVNEATDIGTTACTQSSQYNPPNGNTTIPSGIYCGGINIGNSNANVTFATGGIFEIRNGNLSISNGTVSGTNVMFWFTSSSPSSTVDPVVTINTSSVTLSAPSSGTFKGILFYGDPTGVVAGSGTNNTIQAGASPNLTGTFYFPTGNILFSGQATNNNGYIALIAYRIQINGQSALKWDTSGTYTGLATYGSSGTTYTPNLLQ